MCQILLEVLSWANFEADPTDVHKFSNPLHPFPHPIGICGRAGDMRESTDTVSLDN